MFEIECTSSSLLLGSMCQSTFSFSALGSDLLSPQVCPLLYVISFVSHRKYFTGMPLLPAYEKTFSMIMILILFAISHHHLLIRAWNISVFSFFLLSIISCNLRYILCIISVNNSLFYVSVIENNENT